jgi:hypothetical protein
VTTDRKTTARALAIVLACIAVAALFAAGPASAASRGFMLKNKSKLYLHLSSVSPSRTACEGGPCPMGFEGRPDNGADLGPERTHDWELKYFPYLTYAAVLKYHIVGPRSGAAYVEYTIETNTLSNDSSCKVVPPTAGKCTAEGLHLSFDD